jgi:hypothetical protein
MGNTKGSCWSEDGTCPVVDMPSVAVVPSVDTVASSDKTEAS